jgi:hypothetical protein
VLAYNAGGLYYNDYDNQYTNKWYLNKVKSNNIRIRNYLINRYQQ